MTVCTDVFASLGAAEARQLGLADLPLVVVGHPLGSLTTADVRAVGDAAVDEVAGALTADHVTPREPPRAAAEAPGPRRLAAPLEADDLLDFFEERGWTDGLPVVPPTVERVERVLAYLGRAPDEVVAVIPPRQGLATLEAVVANAVMAGCRAEHLPVLLAALEAVCRPAFNLYGIQATTGSVTPAVVVLGPGAHGLGIRGDVGCLGPGGRANAAIGRALRLVMWNVGGGRPGELDRATHGQPAKYALCFAENQRDNPWPPLHVERGFPASETVVLATGVMGTEDLFDYCSTNADDLLTMLSECLRSMAANHVLIGGYSLFVLAPEHAEMLADAGYGRADVQRALVERATVRVADFPETARVVLRRKRPGYFAAGEDPEFMQVFDSPDHLQVVVAGGPGPHSVFCPGFGDLSDPQTVAVAWP